MAELERLPGRRRAGRIRRRRHRRHREEHDGNGTSSSLASHPLPVPPTPAALTLGPMHVLMVRWAGEWWGWCWPGR
jgi:hypothetical protein